MITQVILNSLLTLTTLSIIDGMLRPVERLNHIAMRQGCLLLLSQKLKHALYFICAETICPRAAGNARCA